MLLIDKYAYTNRLRRISPYFKIGLALTGIVLNRIINHYYTDFSIIVIMAILIVKLADVPLRIYLKMMALPLLFLLLSIITIMISINGTNYIAYFKVFNLYLGVTEESINRGMKLSTTVLSSLSSIYFLMLTTPIIDIIRVLKKAKVPDLLIELMVLIYRSTFIFLEEAHNIYIAQTMKFGYENIKNSMKSASLLIRNLFVRVLIKHKEMNISLECKLYNGEFKLGD